MTAPIWIKWQVGGLSLPEVGQRVMIAEEPIYDEEGNTIGTGWLDEPVPSRVARIGAHWSCQPEGRSGYWVLVEPVRMEPHDLHGIGDREHEVYDMPCVTAPVHGGGERRDYWSAVTDVPCPVPGCDQTVIWYEAGYVPGYRVCMKPSGDGYDHDSLRHRFIAGGNADAPVLVRDDCCEAAS